MTTKQKFKISFFWLAVGFVLHYIISIVAVLTEATMTNVWIYVGLPFFMFFIGNLLDWMFRFSK